MKQLRRRRITISLEKLLDSIPVRFFYSRRIDKRKNRFRKFHVRYVNRLIVAVKLSFFDEICTLCSFLEKIFKTHDDDDGGGDLVYPVTVTGYAMQPFSKLESGI